MPSRSKSPKRKTVKRSKSRSRSRSVGSKMTKATVNVVTLPVRMTVGAVSAVSPKRKTASKRSKSPKRKASKSPKPVAKAVMKGMSEKKPEIVTMMSPLPSPQEVVGMAAENTVVSSPMKVSSKSPKRKTASKSPKRKVSKSPKRKTATRSKSPKSKVKVMAFGVMPTSQSAVKKMTKAVVSEKPSGKPKSPRRMSKSRA